VNPGMRIPAEATAVHGITDEMVADAPKFPLVAPAIVHGLEGCDLVAFNGSKLDVPFLQREIKDAGLGWQVPEPIDPWRINLKYRPRSLSDLYREAFGEEMGGAHDALADVRGMMRLLRWQAENYSGMPRTPAAILGIFSEARPGCIDSEGKFAWRDGIAVVNFGNKWAGTRLERAKYDHKFRDYLGWMIRSEFKEDAKKICRDALVGRYPVKPAGDTQEGYNGEEKEAGESERQRGDAGDQGEGQTRDRLSREGSSIHDAAHQAESGILGRPDDAGDGPGREVHADRVGQPEDGGGPDQRLPFAD